MATALGFTRPAKPWDDLAMGRRRYCFDSLVFGMNMDLALGDMYHLSFDGFSMSGERAAHYSRFVDLIRLNVASIFFVPQPLKLRAALAVRSRSRRIVNGAEVSAELSTWTGSEPLLIDFERHSVHDMLTALLPIQLLMGMYGSGLMNGMFICSLGATPSHLGSCFTAAAFYACVIATNEYCVLRTGRRRDQRIP